MSVIIHEKDTCTALASNETSDQSTGASTNYQNVAMMKFFLVMGVILGFRDFT